MGHHKILLVYAKPAGGLREMLVERDGVTLRCRE
jgi:hypothetical protein